MTPYWRTVSFKNLPDYFLFFLLLLSLLFFKSNATPYSNRFKTDTFIIKDGFDNERLSVEWRNALIPRMTRERLDSFSLLQRKITAEELAWKKLIQSKTGLWNSFRDSLLIPFTNLKLPDTICVMLGLFGSDDGFTYGPQTVCLDLTALQSVYGPASLAENNSRIDRIFAHEYTHLLHKVWAHQHQLKLSTFRDSILWECLYEGIGMYRSLNPRWVSVQGILPDVSKKALENLYPIFVRQLITIQQNSLFTTEEKKRLNKNLSRGNVNQKWGAFPIAIWLSLEANGDDKKLQQWIDLGPVSVIELAKKYLPADLNQQFREVFK